MCRLLALDRPLRRLRIEKRRVFSESSEEEDDELDEPDDEALRAPLAHLAIACSTIEASIPSPPPALEDEDEDEEDCIDDGVAGRVESEGSPLQISSLISVFSPPSSGHCVG